MPVHLRNFASASAVWASCSSPRIFSAISVASTTGALLYRGPLDGHPAVERCLVSPHGLSEAHMQRIGGQFVPDRGLGKGRQRRDQRRQILQIEIVSDIDDEPQFGG